MTAATTADPMMQLKTRLKVTTKVAPAAKVAVISQEQLVDMLVNINGAKMLSFVASTEPKMNKTSRVDKSANPFLDQIVKIAKVAGMVNFKYDEGVRRRLQKEDKDPNAFVGGESWHEAIIDHKGRLTPLCRHKKDHSRVYVRFACQSRVEAEYKDKRTDKEVDEATLKPFLPKPNEYKNQGLDKPLIFLTYGIETIESVTVDKTLYIVVRNT